MVREKRWEMREDGGPELNSRTIPGRQRRLRRFKLVGAAISLAVLFSCILVIIECRQVWLDGELIKAIQERRESAAVSLLNQGANPNARDSSSGRYLTLHEMLMTFLGRRKPSASATPSALVIAFNRDEEQVITALLNKGAGGANGADSVGVPFLVHTVEFNSEDTVRLLIEKGASKVNAQTEDGVPLIVFAAQKGKWDTVNLLLDKGADAGIYPKRCMPALYEAIHGVAPDKLVQRLIDLSGNTIRKPELGACLDIAVVNGSFGVAKRLYSMGARIGDWKESAYPSMVAAAEVGDIARMELLLSYGADVDVYEARGTPLCAAAEAGDLQAADFLIKHGAKVNRGARGGENALSHCVGRFPEMVDFLLKNGADPNRSDGWGVTPLMRAATAGNEASAKLLIEAGAHVNDEDRDSNTALYEAVDNGSIEVTRLLLKHGARHTNDENLLIDASNKLSTLAPSAPKHEKLTIIVRLLKQAGARK